MMAHFLAFGAAGLYALAALLIKRSSDLRAGPRRTLLEVRVAREIENRFTKDEILAAYVNSAYLGGQAFGFEAAASTYFRKSVDELTLSETALLVGVLPRLRLPADAGVATSPAVVGRTVGAIDRSGRVYAIRAA